MATNQKRGAQVVGFYPLAPGSSTLQLAAAATWIAFSFIGNGKTLNKVRVYVSAVAGTLTSLSADIYSDAVNVPNASLGTTTTITGGVPVGAGWIEFTGLSFVTVLGTQYWIVLKNPTATPASNNPTYGFAQNCMTGPFGAGSTWGWSEANSANSGSTWPTTNRGVASMRLGYSDGSYEGLCCQSMAAGTDVAFGSSEVGVKFTTPPNAIWNVRGAAFMVRTIGTPTGNLRFRLYSGTTLLDTTYAIPVANVVGSLWYSAYFAGNNVIQPGTVLRVSMSNTAADSVANGYRATSDMVMDADANSFALHPFEGTLEKSVLSAGSWTDTATSILPFALMLDSDGEFGAGGGTVPTEVFGAESLQIGA